MYDSLTLTSRELITSRPKCFDTRARKGRAYKTRSIDTTTVCVDKNDVSERAYQLKREGQWDKGKGCDTFAPMCPWLVTKDKVVPA
jgi:2-keto-4-pentenoate hydratase/2-oxohepta-3-ene-1,7-dioic acid hydratase in catechol pathway